MALYLLSCAPQRHTHTRMYSFHQLMLFCCLLSLRPTGHCRPHVSHARVLLLRCVVLNALAQETLTSTTLCTGWETRTRMDCALSSVPCIERLCIARSTVVRGYGGSVGDTPPHIGLVFGAQHLGSDSAMQRLSSSPRCKRMKRRSGETMHRRDKGLACQSASVSVSVWITPPRMCVPQLVKTIDVLGKEVAIARKNIKFLTKDSATLRAQLQQFVLAWLHVVCVWVLYVSVCLTECLCFFLSACRLQFHSRSLVSLPASVSQSLVAANDAMRFQMLHHTPWPSFVAPVLFYPCNSRVTRV